ncbi:capsular polysaccharide synthesis protein [Salinicola sp. JS01]|uniref:capsular polysaccharide synthesis protein n=1 Tax=Salinicola sp. JS01 TaxID=3050071 RepID=UPI00255B66D1|nr:capsular polysaccharide synthesis protein [Salinicola sp. JS01]WIX32887.1 capsular polysaccharide synthesis protein [Salinicola sp. JS01]
MLNQWLASRNFERKGFWLRRHSAWLDKRYCYVHGIGGSGKAQAGRHAHRAASAILSAAETRESPGACSKIIWMYWHAPLEQAPEVVQLSVRSWQVMNPDYEVRLLSDDTLEAHLGFDFMAAFELCRVRLKVATKADVLRLYLLSRFGGVWADATLFCLKPLETWMPLLIGEFGFYTFRREAVVTRPIEVWFIAAQRGDPIIQHVFDLLVTHLFRERPRALYVSNSRKCLQKVGIDGRSSAPIGVQIIRDAERHGFVPYFATGYCFNDALETRWSETCKARFFAADNRYADRESHGEMGNFVVSKESYKKAHQSTATYQRRKIWLERTLADMERRDITPR